MYSFGFFGAGGETGFFGGGKGEGSTEALRLPVHMLIIFGSVFSVFFYCYFFKCSCTSYHLGAEMAMSKLSYKSKLLGL